MQALLEKITFEAGRFWCLHAADADQIEAIYPGLVQRFSSENINGVIAWPATGSSVRRRFFRQSTVGDWLAQNGGISPDHAAKIIDGFPVRVAPRLNQNAMNPIRFLGLAAAIASDADVIVYSTSGMDPRGRALIHEYAPAHYPDGCLIHVSPKPLESDPLCPPTAKCAIINCDRRHH